MNRFQKLLKKIPFNNILPQVQSIKVDVFLSIALFSKQNTMEVMVVNGMFFLSCRINILDKSCDRQRFLIDTFFVLFRSSAVDTQG